MHLQDAHRRIIGRHSLDDIADILGISRDYAAVIVSRLKKNGYVTVRGSPRTYTISARKKRPRADGMYDWINRYNPVHIQVNPSKDHQVHGPYGPEDALLDAIDTKNLRVIRAALRLFNHIEDWKHLYRQANRRGTWNIVGALYDLARRYMRVRRRPKRYSRPTGHARGQDVKPAERTPISLLREPGVFEDIQRTWGVFIPFNEVDMEELTEEWV